MAHARAVIPLASQVRILPLPLLARRRGAARYDCDPCLQHWGIHQDTRVRVPPEPLLHNVKLGKEHRNATRVGRNATRAPYETPNPPYGDTKMTFTQAKHSCHVRSAIRRKSQPDIRYWKNHQIPLELQVPYADKLADDWEEYDPREHTECSEFDETPA